MIPMTHICIYIYGSCIIYFYITYTYLYMIHVLYIYHLSTHIWIHLGCFGGKCAYIFHTWSIWDHNFDIKRINIPVEIFVTKSEASGPLQNGFWLPFCAKFWPWVLPSCKWTPPWYRNFALEVRVCYPPVPTILSESGGLINNHYKLDGFKA